MTYRTASQFYWRCYKLTSRISIGFLFMLAAALFLGSLSGVLVFFAGALVSGSLAGFFSRHSARTFDHALTSRLTRDVLPPGISPRERDWFARVKRGVSGGG